MRYLLASFVALMVLASCGVKKDMPISEMPPMVYQAPIAPTPKPPEPPTAKYDREEYVVQPENGFLDVLTNPLSTFSVDVDAASYANVRRFLNRGEFPPPEAVRVEELINYFQYDYPQPIGEHPFSIYTELGRCPWNAQHNLLHIGLQGKEIDWSEAPPANLVFLIDISGSMNAPNKLPMLKSALKFLVDNLRPEDRIAIVTYASGTRVALSLTKGYHKDRIVEAIDNLRAGGSTAGASGIEAAYRVAAMNSLRNTNNRVILATDGDFNVGPSSFNELKGFIEEKRSRNIYLSVLGFGEGNIKDSKMEMLADCGNGNYAYIDNIMEAHRVLVQQLGGTIIPIADDVKIQIEFNPVRVAAYRLIGYENRLLADEDFNDDKKDAGEIGSGHTVTALYEIIPAGGEYQPQLPDIDPLKYRRGDYTSAALSTNELANVKFRYKKPGAAGSVLIEQTIADSVSNLDDCSPSFLHAAAVAEFGMLLRKSQFCPDASYGKVLALTARYSSDDAEGYRAEFARLCQTASIMAGENIEDTDHVYWRKHD